MAGSRLPGAGPPLRRSVAWARTPSIGGLEWVEITLGLRHLSATGTAIGVRPLSYRLAHRLTTGDAYVTQRLRVEVRGEGWQRTLDLRRSSDGAWTAERSARGSPDLPPAVGDLHDVDGALDCDLGLSPATNSMPVLREGLLHGGRSIELVMAWVSVPDLSVQALRQRYTFLRREADRAVVRFESGTFRADLTFDADGIVIDYPRLARRLGGRH